MDREIKELLAERIKADICNLDLLVSGSNEKSKAIEDLATLYKLKIEETKNELDFTEKCDRRVMEDDASVRETELKKAQLSESVYDRLFRAGVDVAGIILPLVCYGIWYKAGLKFEETGIVTSPTVRGLTSRFRPTKK